MGRCAEAEQADAFAFFDPGDAEAAVADDPGAEQGRGLQVVERVRQRVDEIRASDDEFGIASIDSVAGENGRITEVLHPLGAVGAVAVSAAKPGHADALAGGYDFPDDLVAGDQAFAKGAELALDDVKVCTANTAGAHFQENLACRGDGLRDVLNLQWTLGNRSRSPQDGGFHAPRVRQRRFCPAKRNRAPTQRGGLPS